jgi:tripartite-type tricarboxylate transporter receptor subunit TctC
MSPAIASQINSATNKILALPDVQSRFEKVGAITGSGTPEDLGKLLASEIATIGALVDRLGLKPA